MFFMFTLFVILSVGREALRFSMILSLTGARSANFATQGVLSEKLRFPCFPQVPAGSDCPVP